MPLRKRRRPVAPSRPKSSNTPPSPPTVTTDSMSNILRRQPVWIILAVASGACAAFNGVFAKLTTTALTSTLSSSISRLLSLSPSNRAIEVLTRGFFFGMNLLFNVAMWALFTAALTRATSTTRVSIVNVSANFMVTAVLGWMIFGENLPPLWWVGAALLACGNVVIGRREEGEKPGGTVGWDETREEAENLLLGEEVVRVEGRGRESVELVEGEGEGKQSLEEQRRVRKGEAVDSPI